MILEYLFSIKRLFWALQFDPQEPALDSDMFFKAKHTLLHHYCPLPKFLLLLSHGACCSCCVTSWLLHGKRCRLLERGSFLTSHSANINSRAMRKSKTAGKQRKSKALGLLYLRVERQHLKTELHSLPMLISKYLNRSSWILFSVIRCELTTFMNSLLHTIRECTPHLCLAVGKMECLIMRMGKITIFSRFFWEESMKSVFYFVFIWIPDTRSESFAGRLVIRGHIFGFENEIQSDKSINISNCSEYLSSTITW